MWADLFRRFRLIVNDVDGVPGAGEVNTLWAVSGSVRATISRCQKRKWLCSLHTTVRASGNRRVRATDPDEAIGPERPSFGVAAQLGDTRTKSTGFDVGIRRALRALIRPNCEPLRVLQAGGRPE